MATKTSLKKKYATMMFAQTEDSVGPGLFSCAHGGSDG